ncbi:MAG: MFS transporter [Desulfosarcinaceae bacterium]|jgi:EmrB/QacA subfamily drug resistance transporter
MRADKQIANGPSSGASKAFRLPKRQRNYVIAAALAALFLGALDALIISTAMPTIVADLGGLELFSWVYAAYFLSRAISLPIFGKLTDRLPGKPLFIFSITLFSLASLAAGLANSMLTLTLARVFQGIGAGGNFALVYIVLSEVAAPEQRGRTLSLASSIWGIASVLGPPLGGVIVTWWSWRWIFWLNVPVGTLVLVGIWRFFAETRQKSPRGSLDLAGFALLTTSVLALLSLLLMGGRNFAWLSAPGMTLMVIAPLCALGFYWVELRAEDPLLAIDFFRRRGFASGNAAAFLSSFAIFALFAFAPLFIQGVMGRKPLEVGLGMLALSLGWSVGSLLLGQVVHRVGHKSASVAGALLLSLGCGLPLFFGTDTTMAILFMVYSLIGLGMGGVSLATLLVVQESLTAQDLGVATSTNQLARTLGGTVGVGVCGGVVNLGLKRLNGLLPTNAAAQDLSANHQLADSGGAMSRILQPEVLTQLPAAMQTRLQEAVADTMSRVQWCVLAAALLCLLLCLTITTEESAKHTDTRG